MVLMKTEKRILLINPNTSETSTRNMQEVCKRISAPGTHADAVNPKVSNTFNIPVIQCWTDEYITAIETLRIIREKARDYDGIIIACFSDPGLDAARELVDIPILGIGETS